MQHCHGDDEGQVEPVGHVDVGFLALDQGSQEHGQIGQPDDGQPPVDIPFRLGIFLGLRRPQQIAGCGQNDHQLITPEDEPCQVATPQARGACPLDHVKGGRDQRVAPEGEDHRRGVQRTHPPEVQISVRPLEIKRGKGKLKGDDHADQKPDNPPTSGGDHSGAHDAVHVFSRKIALDDRFTGLAQRPEEDPARCGRHYKGVHQIGKVTCVIGRNQREKRDKAKHDQLDIIQHFASLLSCPGDSSRSRGFCRLGS